MGEPIPGPQPDVLARLAASTPAPDPVRADHRMARALGVVLCLATAGTVVAAALLVGQP